MAQESNSRCKPWFYHFIKIALFILFKLCFRFRSYGGEKIPMDERGVILAPNHSSYLDPPAAVVALKRRATFLAKEYLFKVPVFGTALYWIGVLPVKSETDEFRSIRQVIRALRDGKMIVVFPEGTRSADDALREAEGGVGFLAVKSAAWVVPVYISGTFKAFPRQRKMFRPHPVSTHYGEPFIPAQTPEIMNDPDPYLATGRRIMAAIRRIKEEADAVR